MYATVQHITDRYGQDALILLTDRQGTGAIDTDVVDQALRDASAEIDTYLAAKYSLPLSLVPDVLVRLCVDIVMYRLAADRDLGTEERRKRYDDATALLTRIAKGLVSLGVPTPPASSNGVAFVQGPKRRFGRGKLL